MRPLMLGIADASHPAHHRYPVWWTGDDKGLGYSINSMVQLGVTHLKPYVHSYATRPLVTLEPNSITLVRTGTAAASPTSRRVW